jgi:heat shock protein HslJ
MKPNIFPKFALILLSLSMLLAACTPFGGLMKNIDLAPLYSGTWHLVAYGKDDDINIVSPGLPTFIKFQEDGNLYGNAGCNNFFGSFEAKENGSFSVIEPLGATMMFCERFMDEESAFLAALQSAKSLEFNDVGQLVIRLNDSEEAEFMLFVNQSNVSLYGTGWVLSSLVDPDGEITVPPISAPLLTFSEDGGLYGSGGCNRIMSGFTSEGNTIAIDEIASSMMYCDGLMELEDRFNRGLAQVSRFEISGDRLVLSDEASINVLTFTGVEFLLTETKWQLNTLNSEAISEDLLVTLTLSPGENSREGVVFGSTGCNRFSGTYTMDGDRLNINVLVVTVIMCDFGMEIETAFLEALRDPLTYKIEFNRLILVSENNALVFLGEKPSVDGVWKVSILGDPQNPVEMTFDQTILAEFNLEEGANTGLLSGATPCQDYDARFFVDRNIIRINVAEVKDLDQCQNGTALDGQYFDALGNAVTYEFSRGNVLLRDKDGKQVLEFSIQY